MLRVEVAVLLTVYLSLPAEQVALVVIQDPNNVAHLQEAPAVELRRPQYRIGRR